MKRLFLACPLVVLAACIAGCMILYFLMSKLFLILYHTEMEDYMGLNEMDSQGLALYLGRVVRAYRELFRPTRFVLYDMYPMRLYYLHYALLTANGALALGRVAAAWRRNRMRAVVLGGLLALIPLAGFPVGYLTGPRSRAIVHGDISTSNTRHQRRKNKAIKRRQTRQPKKNELV